MSKVNTGQASSTLIPKYIGSDFDKVVAVADNIEQVVIVSDNVEDVGTVADNINYVKEVAEDLHGMPVTMYTGETPPVLNPMPEGVMWYCTTDGRTYVWYTDADSGQWVESAPQSAMKDEATNIFFHSTPSNVNPAYRSATLYSTPAPEAEISVAHNALNTPVVQAQFIREGALWVDVSVIDAQGSVTLMGYSSGNSQLKAEIITWKNGAEGTSLGASQWVTLPSQPSVVFLPVTLANIDVLAAGVSYVVKLTSQMNAGCSAVSTILVDGNTNSRFGIIFNTNLIGLNNGIRDGVITSAPTENAVYDALQLKADKTEVSDALQLKVGKSQLVQSGNLTSTANWANVPAYSDSELGGSGGPLNAQAKALIARSELLLTDVRESLRRSYAEAGYNLVSGSFEAGGTLANTKDVLLHEASGKAYTGSAGTVAAGTNPAGGGFVDVSNSVVSSTAVDVIRPSDAAGSTFPKRLDFYFKSAPINLIEALPSNYVTDGSVDYSTYVQKVCEYLKYYGGGKIIVPHNMKILIGGIKSYANIEWFGNDWTSELLVKPSFYGISVNEGTGGTTNPDDNARNCVFSGFRMRGQVETGGFLQHLHLLNLNAVSALTIQDMSIMGAQGDHIYLGSSNVGGVERHNEDVTIDRLFVDGINKNQRNGISIVDCNGLKITNSRFKRVTRSDMPGAIDIEPNNNEFHVVKNITIEDILVDDCGTNGVGVYVPPLPAAVAGNATNIRFNRINVINSPGATAAYILVRRDVPRYLADHGCSMTKITGKNINRPLTIEGVSGGVISDCSFENATAELLIGHTWKPVRDLKIEKLSLTKCGTTTMAALGITNAMGIEIRDSKFVDCGDPIAGGDIRFNAGTSERVKLISNMHDNPAGGNSRVVSVAEGHVFNPNTNQCLGNTYQGSKLTSEFRAFRNDETNGVRNVFVATTPPKDFPPGTSTALWDSPAGTLPVGYTQGVCVTENVGSTIGINQVITQRFTPRGNGTQLETFYRYASGDGLSWGAWRKVTAS